MKDYISIERRIAADQVPIAAIALAYLDRRPDPKHPHPTENNAYYLTSAGRLQIAAKDRELWHLWHSDTKGAGAIGFVQAVGLAHGFRAAVEFLESLPEWQPATLEAIQAARAREPEDLASTAPFGPPMRITIPLRNWAAVRDYLCRIRKLPEGLLKPLVEGARPAVYAGYAGDKGERDYGAGSWNHYLMFPQYASAVWRNQPIDRPEVGVIMRYRGEPPDGVLKTRKSGQGASQRGWWQVGPYPAPTLIVTEAPIDALTLWAALPDDARATTRIIATGGADTPKAPGVWAGVERLICAQDRDSAGDSQAHEAAVAARMAGLAGTQMVRLTPPPRAKDWSEVWMASPDVVRRQMHRLLVPEAALSHSR